MPHSSAHLLDSPGIPLSAAPNSGRRGLGARRALAIFAAWTVFGLVHAIYWMATNDRRLWIVLTALLLAWTWAALTPLVFKVANAAAPSRVGWPASIAIHGALLAVIALLMTALRLGLITAFTNQDFGTFWARPSFWGVVYGSFWARLAFWLDVHIFTYLTVALTGRALSSHRKYVDRSVRTHVLESQLSRAQLHVLELQLQPHFLFNSLNAISELAHEAPRAAERVLRRLHSLLAMSLERSGRDEVSLADELAALEPYLDIQRTRFEWLSVSVRADDEARTARVPHFILQPLVENAIRHGLAVRQGPGHIEVTAERRNDRLRMTVRDDGVGLSPAAAPERSGIGLRNAGERLRQLYGADHSFTLREATGGGVMVEIEVPFRKYDGPAPNPAWLEATRSRESTPEIAVEDIAAWRTGEFVAAVNATGESRTGLKAQVSGPVARAARAEERRRDVAAPEPPAPLMERVERASEPAAALITMRTWLSLVLVWLAAASFWTGQMHLYYWLDNPTQFMWDVATSKVNLGGAMYWAASSLGVLYLSRRFRLRKGRLLRHLAIHVAAATLISFGFLWVLYAIRLTTTPILSPFNINPLTGNFFVYFALLSWSHSRDFVAWYRAREMAAAELTSQIARSRFQALCVRVRPQFLLGTLELLARLVYVDVYRAERLIARLADVLRLTLDMARGQSTSLKQELQLVAATVEAHRLGIRPGVALRTDIDPEALGTEMPSRLLCTMVDDLLAAEPEVGDRPVPALDIVISAERTSDATRVRLHSDVDWASGANADPHAWWRKKSAADAAVADAGPLVTVAFPDRTTAVLIIADEPPAARTASVAA